MRQEVTEGYGQSWQCAHCNLLLVSKTGSSYTNYPPMTFADMTKKESIKDDENENKAVCTSQAWEEQCACLKDVSSGWMAGVCS